MAHSFELGDDTDVNGPPIEVIHAVDALDERDFQKLLVLRDGETATLGLLLPKRMWHADLDEDTGKVYLNIAVPIRWTRTSVYKLSDLPNDLVTAEDLERLGITGNGLDSGSIGE